MDFLYLSRFSPLLFFLSLGLSTPSLCFRAFELRAFGGCPSQRVGGLVPALRAEIARLRYFASTTAALGSWAQRPRSHHRAARSNDHDNEHSGEPYADEP